MKNKFKFVGVKAQPRRKAAREFTKKGKRPDYDKLEIASWGNLAKLKGAKAKNDWFIGGG
ncbi:MAG: hypothetical protein FH762_15795 [Firmicutes bacterium]|nr:hypothetical protein [Bacillota bacterium]